jgi:3-hydroxyisobutyrate dehydrogenase-like beta-hydroxyacid dehydrogenase
MPYNYGGCLREETMADKNHLKCIGVVGLGNMGNALAGALLAHGFRVAVWNRTGSKAAPLVEKGAMLAGSAAEAAEMSDVTVVCVAEHAVIAAVVQTNEVAQAIRGKALLQLGVVTAEQAAETADWAGRHDVDYLEGSILGVPDNVADGTATLVCSGPTQQFEALSHAGVHPRGGDGKGVRILDHSLHEDSNRVDETIERPA